MSVCKKIKINIKMRIKKIFRSCFYVHLKEAQDALRLLWIQFEVPPQNKIKMPLGRFEVYLRISSRSLELALRSTSKQAQNTSRPL